MKRKIGVLLLLTLCIHFLLGFGFTKVYKVEKAIDAIGLVTIESREKIETAESMYAELSTKNKEKVDNYYILLQARAELDRLVGLVNTAQSAIDAIQEPITLSNGSTVVAAQRAYRAAREASVHSYITGFDKLWRSTESYLPLAMEEANKLMNQRKYTDAYMIYSTIYEVFPSSAYGTSALNGCWGALIGEAEVMYNNGQLENALDSLDDIDAYYGFSQQSNQLREKILNRIAQNRPLNGQTFNNTIGWGYGKLTVTAGDYDEFVTLTDIDTYTKIMTFYVRAGETATVQVKDGRYAMEYIGGPYWFGTESKFGGYYKDTGTVNGDLIFSTARSGSQVEYTLIEVDLRNISFGDWITPEVSNDKPIEHPVKNAYASSTYSGDRATHDVTNLLDNDRKTNWTEGVEGDGIGEYIRFEFWDEYSLKSIAIYAGNQYDRNRYLDNNRPEKITIGFSDGSSVSVTLKDIMEGQTILLPESVVTDSIWITINSVYHGNKYTDTVISDISFEAYASAFN